MAGVGEHKRDDAAVSLVVVDDQDGRHCAERVR
jgi:hypothetical protein